MSADLRVTVRETGDRHTVLTVTGALDFRTADTLVEQVTAAMAECRHLVLDLSGVVFCDSSGLSALLLLLRHAQTDGVTLALVAVPAQMARLLAITGAHAVFSLHASLPEALAAGEEAAHDDRPSPGARGREATA